MYRYSFGDLPYGWRASANTIKITNFSPYHSSKWSVKLEVSDTSGNYIQQNVLLSFIGYYVSFTPITLPVRGVRELVTTNNPSSPVRNSTNIIAPTTAPTVTTNQ